MTAFTGMMLFAMPSSLLHGKRSPLSSTEPGFALKIAEARKMAAHNADCRGIGVTSLLGGWSPDSIAQIARKGNATLWSSRLPLYSAWVDGSILFVYVCIYVWFSCFVLFCFVFFAL